MTITEIFNESFWYIAPILVALTTTATGVINKIFNIADKFKQPVSWGTGTVLSCAAIALGFLGENINWPSYIAMSAVVGLSSNGFYDISYIKNWIDSWFVKKS